MAPGMAYHADIWTTGEVGPSALRRSTSKGDAGPGGWNVDMLEVAAATPALENNASPLTWWSMLSAPLLLGNDVRDMTPEIACSATKSSGCQIQDALNACKPGFPADDGILDQSHCRTAPWRVAVHNHQRSISGTEDVDHLSGWRKFSLFRCVGTDVNALPSRIAVCIRSPRIVVAARVVTKGGK